MLPQKNRLSRKKDFERVFKKGKGAFFDILGVKSVKGQADSSRFGFIVSSKISKKAVIRNRIKRQLREALRMQLKYIRDGYDLAVIALPGITDADFTKMQKTISFAIKKLKLEK